MANAQKTFYVANFGCGVYNPSYPGLTQGQVQSYHCGMVGETNTNKGSMTRVRAIHGYKFNPDWSGVWGIEAATLRLYYWNGVEMGSGFTGLDDNATNLTSQYTIGIPVNDWWNPAAMFYTWDTTWTSSWINWNTYINHAYGTTQQKTHVSNTGFNSDPLDFDVTAIVNAWWTGAYPNHGFRVGLDAHQGASFLDLQERSMNFDMARAELIITYTINQAPYAPIVQSPKDNAVILGTSPVLTATISDPDGGDYATGWNVQVVSDDNTNPDTATNAQKFYAQYLTSQAARTGNLSVTVGDSNGMYWYQTLQAGQYYKWRMATADKAGAWSPWTALNRWYCNYPPNAPTISIDQSPLDDIRSLSPVVSFDFTDPAPLETHMHGYQVIVEERVDGTFVANYDSGTIDLSGSPQIATTHTLTTLSWATTYRVKVRVQDEYGAWSAYSGWLEFSTHKTETPTNMSPDLAEAVGYTPVLTGYRYGTIDTIDSYWLWVQDSDGNDVWIAQEFFDPNPGNLSFSKTYAGNALTSGVTYTWRARIDSPIGGLSDWSAGRTFTVVDAAVPNPIAPQGDQQYTLFPTFQFDRATSFNAVQYQIYYADAKNTDAGVDDTGTDAHFDSGTVTTGISAGGLGTQFSQAYGGTPSLDFYDSNDFYDPGTNLQPKGSYRWRARVSSDSGTNWSNWSGLIDFRTDHALPPILQDVSGEFTNPAWIVTPTPYFNIDADGTDTIDYYNIRICDSTHNTDNPVFESGFVNLDPNATSAYWIYTGPSDYVQPGVDYTWDARIQDTTGARSDWSPHKTFTINNPPDTPFGLYPPPGGGHDASTGQPVMKAYFRDRDTPRFKDGPTEWEIRVTADSPPFDQTISTATGLVVGENSKLWNGTALSVDIQYEWSCRFKDQKGAWSEWAPWASFYLSDPPNGTWLSPDNGSQLTTTTPTVTWDNLVGTTTQARYMITIQRTNGAGTPIWGPINLGPYQGTEESFTIPPGILVNGYSYFFTITIWNDKGLVDPTPDTVEVDINLDAPNPAIFTVAVANAERSNIYLEWSRPSDNPPVYVKGYRLYRKKRWKEDYVLIAEFHSPVQTAWTDYYAGNSIDYTYKIVAIGQKAGTGVYIEGSDESGSFWTLQNNSDNWTIVGRDRNAAHIYDMVVVDEDHNRPIQQEEFETLGSDRKVIMRGFVLGHEGSITAIWTNTDDPLPQDEQEYVNHTEIGRSLIEYLTFDAGPHIIKSPFGDVWDVQILTPEYKWLPTGHLETTFKYVETGKTSPREGD